MKNYLKIISVGILLIFIGCSDLEEDPKSILAPEGFFTTYDDVEASILGVYGRMTANPAWGGETTQAMMLLSDMVDVGLPGAASQNFEINEFRATSEHYYSTIIWRRVYDIINAANTSIQGARQIDIDESLKLRLEAEARVLRAIHYLTFAQIFGAMPYLDEPVSEVSAALEITRTSETELYAKVLEDLEFAFVEGRLPNTYEGNAKTRVTRGTVATVLASLYLLQENWQKAYDTAKWIIDNKAVFGYDLVSDYQDLFDAKKHDGIAEHILAVDFLGLVRHADNDDTLSPLTGVGFISGNAGGWSIIVPTMAVYDDWDDNDYRKGVAFDTTVVDGNGVSLHYSDFIVKRPHIAKYNRFVGDANGSGRRSDINYPLYRYAEVLLIAAEALNELSGGSAEAAGYVNEVRARARNGAAGGPPSVFPEDVALGLTQDAFRDLVLEERRLELSFEYKRWFDIRRRQLGDEVFKGSNSLEPQPNFDSSKHYVLPVPQSEIDVNPNITQNPGY